jgi:hypothetical protein
MDLRVLFPADTRYGPMVFSTWRPEIVICGLLTNFRDVNEVIVCWWTSVRANGPTPRMHNLVMIPPDSPSRMRSRIACILSDLAQATSVDFDIDADIHDPLV